MRVSIPFKLVAIIALMVVPVLVSTYFVYSDNQEELEQAESELIGLRYIETLKNVFELVPQHRGITQGVLGGDVSQRPELLRVRGKVDETLEALIALDGEIGRELDSTDRLQTIAGDWQSLKTEGESLAPAESFARHTRVIAEMLDLIRHVQNTSRLTADPEVKTSYLIGILAEDIPIRVERLGVLRGLTNGMASRQLLTPEERASVVEKLTVLETTEGEIASEVEVVYALDQGLSPELRSAVVGTTEVVATFLQAVRNDLLEAEVITVDPFGLFELGTSAITANLLAFDQAVAETRSDLLARRDALRGVQRLQLGLAIGMTLLAALAGFLVSRGINRQVEAITHLFAQVGIGNFDARTEVVTNDELGSMASNLNAMLATVLSLVQSQEEKDQIQANIQKLLMEIADAADGDLTVEAEVTAEITGAIADSFNYLLAELRTIITRVQDTTLQVSSAASEVQATAEHLAKGSEMQSSQIVDTTAAVDEMATSIQQVSANSETAARVAQEALDSARSGSSAVGRTIDGMGNIRDQVQETAKRLKRLGESSQEVGEIVQLIGDIADRTSILALNASIQAAMAGEAGRGFAVVAEEVERLAERSAEATKRIDGLIKNIQIETGEAVSAMEDTTKEVVSGSGVANEAGHALQQIEKVSSQLAELIQAISMSSKQQARGSESVARSMGEISEVTQQTAAGTKQAAVSISTLAELADSLRESVSTFKLPNRAA